MLSDASNSLLRNGIEEDDNDNIMEFLAAAFKELNVDDNMDLDKKILRKWFRQWNDQQLRYPERKKFYGRLVRLGHFQIINGVFMFVFPNELKFMDFVIDGANVIFAFDGMFLIDDSTLDMAARNVIESMHACQTINSLAKILVVLPMFSNNMSDYLKDIILHSFKGISGKIEVVINNKFGADDSNMNYYSGYKNIAQVTTDRRLKDEDIVHLRNREYLNSRSYMLQQ